MLKLEESTFLLYAAKHYDNPHCHDVSEFEEDLKRFAEELGLDYVMESKREEYDDVV